MLVFISDLHFMDESAGQHNVPADAFDIFFQDLASTVRWHQEKNRQIREMRIVFLGDIFDLIRTTYWLEPGLKESERPWGSNQSKIRTHAKRVFTDIAGKNEDAFALLQSSLKDRYGLPFEPERIYIPGNHDRLCNRFSGLRRQVRKTLAMPVSDDPFPHVFTDHRYGVIARHGHEFDKFNYEGGDALDYEAHMQVPIGDPITTELATKLPWLVLRAPKVKALPKKYRDRLEENLQQIDNVRPFSAVLHWLLYQVKDKRALKRIIEESVDQIVREFNKLSYVKRWYDHHDRWTEFLDEADKIQAVLFLLEHFKVFSSERILPLLDKVKKLFATDELAEGAKRENERFRYVVYGHTHTPLQTPIRLVQSHQDEDERLEQVYINTGTWRSRYHQVMDGNGFIGWKNMTYAVFYTAEERGGKLPGFETWTGTLKTA